MMESGRLGRRRSAPGLQPAAPVGVGHCVSLPAHEPQPVGRQQRLHPVGVGHHHAGGRHGSAGGELLHAVGHQVRGRETGPVAGPVVTRRTHVEYVGGAGVVGQPAGQVHLADDRNALLGRRCRRARSRPHPPGRWSEDQGCPQPPSAPSSRTSRQPASSPSCRSRDASTGASTPASIRVCAPMIERVRPAQLTTIGVPGSRGPCSAPWLVARCLERWSRTWHVHGPRTSDSGRQSTNVDRPHPDRDASLNSSADIAGVLTSMGQVLAEGLGHDVHPVVHVVAGLLPRPPHRRSAPPRS